MSSSHSPEPELLKAILEPLLEDFQYWFSRSITLLESERLSFFSEAEQAELLDRVKRSKQEVSTAQMLFEATNGQVGIEASMLVPWHQLVSECWNIAMRWRAFKEINEQP